MAGPGVHGGDLLEVGGQGERSLRPADGDNLVFDRLAHHFQNARAELGQLVEKKHVAVSEGDLTG